MINAFQYMKNKEMCSSGEYPSVEKAENCKEKKCNPGISIKSFRDFPNNVKAEIVTELQNGPISVTVDATSWALYTGGIITD
jgi:hypothetical protein